MIPREHRGHPCIQGPASLSFSPVHASQQRPVVSLLPLGDRGGAQHSEEISGTAQGCRRALRSVPCVKPKPWVFTSSSGVSLSRAGTPGLWTFSPSKLKVVFFLSVCLLFFSFFFFFGHSGGFQNCKPERRFDSTNSPQRKAFLFFSQGTHRDISISPSPRPPPSPPHTQKENAFKRLPPIELT